MRAKPGHLIAAAVALVIAVVAGVTLIVHFARTDTASAPGPRAGASTPVSGLPTVKVEQLPGEAVATLTLIDKGGPFPYQQDGSTFRNQENLLPRQETGYYREYTVKTPGSRDRGSRRLVVGRGGDIYYTGDHYESFRQVLR
ncbi:MAG TPA: ribonuclease domain-containing protein [Candidatus Limnocylindrales bacterium]|nr:ribonuclease domain-containing protein [Candidatus Limnocylindrales bacterium]